MISANLPWSSINLWRRGRNCVEKENYMRLK